MKRMDMTGNLALLIVVVLIIYLSPNVSNYLAIFQFSRQESQANKIRQEKVEERVALMLRTVADLGVKDGALRACIEREAEFRARIDPRSTGGRYKASDLDTLNCPGMGIRSLEGVQGMLALRSLNLFRNDVRDVTSLAHLEKLERLDLSENRVVDILPLVGLSNLEYLSLTGNRITDLKPLGEMFALKSLSLPDLHGAFCADVEQLQELSHIRRATGLNGIHCKGRLDRRLAQILTKDPADWTRKEEELYLYYKINMRKGMLNQEEK